MGACLERCAGRELAGYEFNDRKVLPIGASTQEVGDPAGARDQQLILTA